MLRTPLSLVASGPAWEQDAAAPSPSHTPWTCCCPACVKSSHLRGKLSLSRVPGTTQRRALAQGRLAWYGFLQNFTLEATVEGRPSPFLSTGEPSILRIRHSPYPSHRQRAGLPSSRNHLKGRRNGKGWDWGSRGSQHLHHSHPQDGYQAGLSHICLYCEQQVGHFQHSKKKLIYKSRDSVKPPGWYLKKRGIKMRAVTLLSISFSPQTPMLLGQGLMGTVL